MKKLKKDKLNSEMIWKIWKKIVKRYVKYGRKVNWIVKIYGKCGRKVGCIVEWYEKLGWNPSWMVILFGKYRRKLWNDRENMEEK